MKLQYHENVSVIEMDVLVSINKMVWRSLNVASSASGYITHVGHNHAGMVKES